MSASLKKAIYSFLKGTVLIKAAVGDPARLYPQVAPTSAILPYIVYNRISEPGEHHLKGASALSMATFQFDCYAVNTSDANDCSEALRNTLDGFQRKTIGTPPNDEFINSAMVVDQNDDDERPDDGSELAYIRNRVDITFWYPRSLPTL